MARYWLAVLLGGALCFALDHLHVAFGVLFYPHPVFWGQAWWVFPLFAGATMAMIGGARLLLPAAATARPEGWRDIVRLVAAYGFTALAAGRPLVVLATLLLTFVATRAASWRGDSPGLLVFCAVSAVAGTGWEILWSGMGMFTYVHPDLLGVPVWLPALYLHAAPAAEATRRLIDGNRPNRT